MLQDITVEHFRVVVGTTCLLQLSDGSQLPVQVSSVAERPQARASQDQRLPFNVSLDSLQPSDFIDGPCAIELPETGLLQEVFVSRVPAMGRDNRLAYYCISFN
ncbi:hypothetical protein [Pseudomonas syringae]|uniref:Uncharacterized protein n=2 Tax=Pseudomonas syringae group TaxID=136849 RepID=A0A9Q4A567_PSESX|nr:hypothetical protein [Pseudomonas syringae]KTB69802.1 hypothetical protein AO067_22530 [Pseudomonas viridiflava ICMP 13104]MCF5470830.1 hypothetical protein [Pseudomonas syringae]MCF5474499.1 hypothetical protein [Pseudomonas syringae]MCF5484017.1 hypothetical protein [Pseudomonas syringae]MCF5487792.1 hypothetical protein [Pseudomonas syringae]